MFQKGAGLKFIGLGAKKYWSRRKLSGNKVVGYCLEMPNLYSPFQYVSERGGAKMYSLKYWSRENISGDKVVVCCLEMQNNYSPSQYVPERGGPKINFLKC